jgi:hypothetical protein
VNETTLSDDITPNALRNGNGKRGRPKKSAGISPSVEVNVSTTMPMINEDKDPDSSVSGEDTIETGKKKRGRPKKLPVSPSFTYINEVESNIPENVVASVTVQADGMTDKEHNDVQVPEEDIDEDDESNINLSYTDHSNLDEIFTDEHGDEFYILRSSDDSSASSDLDEPILINREKISRDVTSKRIKNLELYVPETIIDPTDGKEYPSIESMFKTKRKKKIKESNTRYNFNASASTEDVIFQLHELVADDDYYNQP